MVPTTKTNGRTRVSKPNEFKAMGESELRNAEFSELVAHFNYATDRKPPEVAKLSSTRRYLYHSARPADAKYQAAIAGELVRRIKARSVPGEYSRLFSLELLTALNQDSPIALQLASNLAGRMRSFSEAHHALDYCTGYWHHEPKLTSVLIERLRALASTDAERDLVEQLA